MEAGEALHHAASCGDLEMVRNILAMEPDDRPAPDGHRICGQTALSSAIVRGHHSVASALLEARADPNTHSGGGWTALHHAVHAGNISLVKLLLLNTADPGASCDKRGRTPALLASGTTAPVMKALLSAAAACLVSGAHRTDHRPLSMRISQVEAEVAPALGTRKRCADGALSSGATSGGDATSDGAVSSGSGELSQLAARALVELTPRVHSLLGSLGHAPSSRADATRLLAAMPPFAAARLLADDRSGTETQLWALGRLFSNAPLSLLIDHEHVIGQLVEADDYRVSALAEELMGKLYAPDVGARVAELSERFATAQQGVVPALPAEAALPAIGEDQEGGEESGEDHEPAEQKIAILPAS